MNENLSILSENWRKENSWEKKPQPKQTNSVHFCAVFPQPKSKIHTKCKPWNCIVISASDYHTIQVISESMLVLSLLVSFFVCVLFVCLLFFGFFSLQTSSLAPNPLRFTLTIGDCLLQTVLACILHNRR